MQQLRRLMPFKAGLSHLFLSSDFQCARRSKTSEAAETRWTCSCGFNNFAFQRQCFRCKKPRDDLSSLPKATPLSLLDNVDAVDLTGGDNTGHSPVLPAEGVWMCAGCNTFNNASRTACIHCGEVRPRLRSPAPSSKASAVSPSPDLRQPFMRGDWYCSCGAHNFARNTHCRACKATAPLGRKGAPRQSAAGGDWVCPECGKYNFARRNECMRCHHPNPLTREREEQRRDVGPTAVSQGWVCQACHSMNPPDVESACVVCGTQK